jgi:hypothetical protein
VAKCKRLDAPGIPTSISSKITPDNVGAEMRDRVVEMLLSLVDLSAESPPVKVRRTA